MRMENKKVGVFAGNYSQYNNFLRGNSLNPYDYFFIRDSEGLRGRSNFEYICFGTYYAREDYGSIMDMLKTRRAKRKETPDA
jgi:hypothetical protein